MKRSSRARIGAAAAVSALSLALVTGYGGDSGAAEASAGSDRPASTPAKAAKALSAAELEKLLLTRGDIKGHKVGSLASGSNAAEVPRAVIDAQVAKLN